MEYRSNGGPHGHEGIPHFEAPKADAKRTVVVTTGEATTAKIAWCSPGPDQTGVYYGGSFKLISRDIHPAFVVTHSSMELTHVNCIFRAVLPETPVQHSFVLQTCR